MNQERAPIGRRLFTNLAIAGILCVLLAITAMWLIAASDGHVRLIVNEYQTPPEFRSNHGPWRHSGTLQALYSFAILATLGVLPLAWIGAIAEQTRRAYIVMGVATLLLFLNCAHFLLFD